VVDGSETGIACANGKVIGVRILNQERQGIYVFSFGK
jgi:hypothetical protein